MLSTENPPPDPQCPCEISHLKSSNEKASDNQQQQQQLEVDLSKFSIRDYVFNTRSKDIKTNWPFSQKNLQLCLKHGVTNLLPPFQSLDYARNLTIGKCDVTSTTRDKESVSNSNGKLSCSSDHLASVSYANIGRDRKLSLDCGDNNSSGSQEEKEFPSTITSHSCSERDSIPRILSPCLEAEAEKFPAPSKEKSVPLVPSSNKSESASKETVKKCRLIVKLSNISDPRLQEDTAANTSVVSETMASKVCPVCKTFSSSSNTTLNAHIDQCLSGESTMKWTENPKVIKHRIKPRKTKLMVDIYETAQHFTLEDLDRRNGTNWASNLGLAAPDMEMSVEEENKASSSRADAEDINEDAAVYIDSNGTKLRILSKFNDIESNSNAKDDCRPRKLEKRNKESKLSSSKKKNLVRKHKLLTSAPRSQSSCFPRHAHRHKIDDGEQRIIPPEERCEKDDSLTQPPLKVCDQRKLNNFGMIRQWSGSKRTGLMKKTSNESGNQDLDKGIAEGLRVKSHQSSLDEPLQKKTSLSSKILPDQKPQSPPESSVGLEDLSRLSHDDGYKDHLLRKRGGFSLPDSQSCHNKKKKHLVLSQCSVKELRNDAPSVLDHRTHPPNCLENHVPPRNNKRMETLGPSKNPCSYFINSRLSKYHAYLSGGKKFSSLRNISLDNAFSSGSKKFSSLTKNELTVSKASIPDFSRKILSRKCFGRKKPRIQYMSGLDEEALASQSAIVRQHQFVEEVVKNRNQTEQTNKLFVNRARVLKIQKKRGAYMISKKKGTTALKSSLHSPKSDSCQAGKKSDCFIGDSVPPPCKSYDLESSGKEVEVSDDDVCEPTTTMAAGGSFMGFSKSLDPEFTVLAGSSDVHGLSQQYLDTNKEPFLDKPVLGGEELFSRDDVGKLMINHSVHMAAELDANEGHGNYFVDVDPIPIPGPPGSFLPSPGRMGSEDLHGNSSLTTCRVLSSEDEHELIDMESSDSPVSATSVVSDSVAARSYSISLERLSSEPDHSGQPETRSSFSQASIDPVVESSSPVNWAENEGDHGVQPETRSSFFRASIDPVESSTPVNLAENGDEGRLNVDESRTDLMFAESNPLRIKNSQPCCCSRKEAALLGVASNYQESQLLRRRTMPSLALPALEKQMGGYSKRNFESPSLRSEILLKNKSSSEADEYVARSPEGRVPIQLPKNSEVKFQTPDDYVSATPSISTPILRLMGKNLMVVNKDKDISAQTRPASSSIINDHAQLLSWVDNAVNSGKNPNENYSLHHDDSVSKVPITFDQLQKSGMPDLHFNVSSSNGSVNHHNHRTEPLSPHPLTPVFSDKKYVWNFSTSAEYHGYMGGCNLTPKQLGSRIIVGTPMTNDIETLQTTATYLRNGDPCRKEIIVIDDTPESGAGSVIKTTCNGGPTELGGSTVGISAPMGDSIHPNPQYNHPSGGYSLYHGSPVVQTSNFQVLPTQVTNASPLKWNCTPDGSSALHANSLTVSSTPKDHLRSTLYSSRRFS